MFWLQIAIEPFVVVFFFFFFCLFFFFFFFFLVQSVFDYMCLTVMFHR